MAPKLRTAFPLNTQVSHNTQAPISAVIQAFITKTVRASVLKYHFKRWVARCGNCWHRAMQ